jgi:hypothetical protein
MLVFHILPYHVHNCLFRALRSLFVICFTCLTFICVLYLCVLHLYHVVYALHLLFIITIVIHDISI